MRVAYLVSYYPAQTHTFVRREVAALRSRGLDVLTCSIHRCICLSEADRAEAARTFCVLPWPSAYADSPERVTWAQTAVGALPHLPGLAWSLVATLVRSPAAFANPELVCAVRL